MKKFNVLAIAMLLCVCGCGGQSTSSQSSENEYVTIVDNFSLIDIEVDETYNISYALRSFPEISATLDNNQIATLESNVISGKTVGESTLTLSLEGKKQRVNINVHEKCPDSLSWCLSCTP